MTILPRKGLLAIAAVVEVALQTDGRPISAKTLATRHGLPPRHLELVLQSLVRDGILKGIRGPHGGYKLAREWRGVTLNDILRAASTVHEAGKEPTSELIAQVVLPVLSLAEQEFGQALSRISLDDTRPPCSPQWQRNGSPRKRRRASRRLVACFADLIASMALARSAMSMSVRSPS
jgi:Rrf2 family protein